MRRHGVSIHWIQAVACGMHLYPFIHSIIIIENLLYARHHPRLWRYSWKEKWQKLCLWSIQSNEGKETIKKQGTAIYWLVGKCHWEKLSRVKMLRSATTWKKKSPDLGTLRRNVKDMTIERNRGPRQWALCAKSLKGDHDLLIIELYNKSYMDEKILPKNNSGLLNWETFSIISLDIMQYVDASVRNFMEKRQIRLRKLRFQSQNHPNFLLP